MVADITRALGQYELYIVRVIVGGRVKGEVDRGGEREREREREKTFNKSNVLHAKLGSRLNM